MKAFVINLLIFFLSAFEVNVGMSQPFSLGAVSDAFLAFLAAVLGLASDKQLRRTQSD